MNSPASWSKPPLVVWGASGHALVVAETIRLQGAYEIVGFLDDLNPTRHGTQFCGATILGGREQLDMLQARGITNLILAFGDCAARLEMSAMVLARGFQLAGAIHPRAIVAVDVPIGPGTIIAAGAVVNPGSRIGENVIINTCASVDHECVVGDGAHIGPGVCLGGRVTVGQGAWVGIGATIRDGVRVGAYSTIGAGAVVLRDVPDNVVAYGVPAKVIRRNAPDDR